MTHEVEFPQKQLQVTAVVSAAYVFDFWRNVNGAQLHHLGVALSSKLKEGSSLL